MTVKDDFDVMLYTSTKPWFIKKKKIRAETKIIKKKLLKIKNKLLKIILNIKFTHSCKYVYDKMEVTHI